MLLELTDLQRSIERELAEIVAGNMPGKPGPEVEDEPEDDEETDEQKPAST